jgi:hypothetical protein
MAITVTLNEIGGNSSPYDGLSIGVYSAWNMEFTTTSTWFGKTINFNPYMFIDPSTPQSPNNTIQTNGFSVTLPGAPGTGNMAILTGPFSPTERNLTCAYDLVSSTILRINLSFLMTSDIDRKITGQVAPSIYRFSKNINSNPNIYDNTTPSVYSGYKLLRGHLTVGDLTMVEDNAFADFQVRGRFFDSGLTPGTPGEFTDWSFELTRGGQPVTNLSAHEDTTLTVTVDTAGAGSISPNAQILIFKESGAVDTTDFITDLAAGVHVNAALITGIDYVGSFTPWAVVSGTVYDCDILIDSDKIEVGATYRIIVTAFDITANLSNTNTTDPIIADALPDPVSGTMTGSISDYNDIFTGDCLQVATVERVKACVSVDKVTYDAALSAQNLPGDFDSNFFSYQVQVVNTLGGQSVLLEANDRAGSDDLD